MLLACSAVVVAVGPYITHSWLNIQLSNLTLPSDNRANDFGFVLFWFYFLLFTFCATHNCLQLFFIHLFCMFFLAFSRLVNFVIQISVASFALPMCNVHVLAGLIVVGKTKEKTTNKNRNQIRIQLWAVFFGYLKGPIGIVFEIC